MPRSFTNFEVGGISTSIVYRKGDVPVIVDDNSVSGHGPAQGFVLNLSKVWTRYGD